jgi:ABC-type transporter Mla MlaB component
LDGLKEARRYWKLKEEAQIALFGELSLEEAMDLWQDRLLLDLKSREANPSDIEQVTYMQ